MAEDKVVRLHRRQAMKRKAINRGDPAMVSTAFIINWSKIVDAYTG